MSSSNGTSKSNNPVYHSHIRSLRGKVMGARPKAAGLIYTTIAFTHLYLAACVTTMVKNMVSKFENINISPRTLITNMCTSHCIKYINLLCKDY